MTSQPIVSSPAASSSAPDLDRSDPAPTCPICGGPGRPRASSWPHIGCRDCGHVWLDQVDGSDPSADNEYFESDDYASWRTQSETLRRRQVDLAASRLAWLGPLLDRPGSILEFGCSTGEAVAALAARGWQASALDPSAPAIDIASAQAPEVSFGVGLTPSEAGLTPSGYDLVMAFHVIEHIADVHGFMELVSAALSPGGHLYLRLPNWRSWSRLVFRDRWPDNMAEHLHHFNPGSLETLLSQHGFTVERLETRGQSRAWIGGVRRLLSSEWAAASTMPATGSRSQAVLAAADTLGRPFFAIERRLGGGSELVVLARRGR